MQGTHRTARGDGMVASTPGSGAPKWTHGGQVDQCSPIREGRSWLSPPRKLKTPEPDAERISSSPLGVGILRTVSQLDQPNPVQTERRRRAEPADSRTEWSPNLMERIAGSSIYRFSML